MNPPDHYAVIDLEATCTDDASMDRRATEIIEIGAVLVRREDLRPVREFQTFVRPVQHPRLTAFCTQLTTITQAQVDAAPGFRAALAQLRAFLEGTNALFCSWGLYDRLQFERDAKYHRVELPFGRRHLNLKEAFSKHLGEPRQHGTGQALRRVGLEFRGTHHRGIDDARNIARLLPWALGLAGTLTPEYQPRSR